MLRQAISEVTRRLADDEFISSQPADVVAEHRRQLGEMKNEYDAIDRVLRKLG
jgi:valyl-tRNA synthetase